MSRPLWIRKFLTFTATVVMMLISIGMYVGPMKSAVVANIGSVYVIPVKRQIERGLTSFMERGFKEAEKMSAGLIILEIDTPGGLVDQAGKIASLMKASDIPIVAHITGDAASAGSYIALNADKIAMAEGA